MRSHIVLIDFENVQPDSLELLLPEHFRVLLFVGATQARLPFETVAALQKLGGRAEYIKIDGNGSNALDFHIAYYIGLLSAAEPSAHFHIVSKDSGFDPLIKHLNSKQVLARRVRSISEITQGKCASKKSLAERVQTVREKLARPNSSKPRTLKTLSSFIAAYFQKQLSEQEVSDTVTGLMSQGFVAVDGKRIVYTCSNNGGVEQIPDEPAGNETEPRSSI